MMATGVGGDKTRARNLFLHYQMMLPTQNYMALMETESCGN
jgi:hypothetical protein